ncbi:hypothetical protein N7493_011527 [Penicillium malachiteum]|uniref:Xylanolytic transcriptional activator regulatory domain-containing protein n=1 Tax=Penicillium malachiteum TaxID=1324776 RepID=A0AAD6HAY5_9EURO|nr:hypothetical protein N7493_011527 [Penicillium malachiteum]
MYPFLDPESFKQQTASPDLSRLISTNKGFAALYYAVVAIGSQHNDGGSFEAGVGEAWSYFERALSYFQDLIFFRGSLTTVQALMAIAVFSSTMSAFQFEQFMLSEAAIMAQGLGYNRSNGPHEVSQRRTFWVLYFMEKVSCFITGKVSVFQDSNISCAIPDVKESTFVDYDYFFSFLRYARLVSRIHKNLLTINAIQQPALAYNSKVQSLLSELESWRLSIPERFRAGEPFRARLMREPLAQTIALMTHYLYLNALLTLSWTLLHFSAAKLETRQQLDLKRELMRTSRSVLELTKWIDVSPSTPVWMLAVLPLSCLMILFDIVVHNPNHPEASLSLALLDIAGGHFSRLEFASKGTLPCSLIAQFAHLARQYVFEQRENKNKTKSNKPTDSDPVCGARQPDAEAEPPSSSSTNTLPMADIPITGTSQPIDPLPELSRDLLELDPATASLWDSSPIGSNDQLFIPLIDDPSYRIEDFEILGIDLKDLFDYPYPILSGDGGL